MKNISLLPILLLLICILCSCGIVDQYEYKNMLEESKQNIAPYLEQIPTQPNSEGKIELPSELHKNIDNVYFCGMSGSVSYKKDEYGVIDKVYWASHDFYTYDEHQEFAKILEDYFNSSAIIEREQYGQWNDVNYYWVDESVPCTVVFYTSVRANHEDEKDRFEVYWDMDLVIPD